MNPDSNCFNPTPGAFTVDQNYPPLGSSSMLETASSMQQVPAASSCTAVHDTHAGSSAPHTTTLLF